jgi:hypothetical protein
MGLSTNLLCAPIRLTSSFSYKVTHFLNHLTAPNLRPCSRVSLEKSAFSHSSKSPPFVVTKFHYILHISQLFFHIQGQKEARNIYPPISSRSNFWRDRILGERACYLYLVCPSVCPRASARLPLDGFS